MPDLFDNPMQLMGFEFVEFAAPDPTVLHQVFSMMGFTKVATHRSKAVSLYRQGGINFILNSEPGSAAAYFASEHGPSACGMAFRIKDSHHAYARALSLGAQPVDMPTGPMELRLPAIKGIGGAPLYLIDRFEEGKSIYDIDFTFIEGVERQPKGVGLKEIDHLTHNVMRGRMNHWAGFYERVFNFREIRYFDIEGQVTGVKTGRQKQQSRSDCPGLGRRMHAREEIRQAQEADRGDQRKGRSAHEKCCRQDGQDHRHYSPLAVDTG